MRYLASIASLALAGCAAAPGNYDPTKLNADQLKALVSDKSDTVSCGFITYATGRAMTVYVNLDKATSTNGSVTLEGDCKTTVTLTGPAKAASGP